MRRPRRFLRDGAAVDDDGVSYPPVVALVVVLAVRVPPEPLLQPAPADARPVPLGSGRDETDEARLPVVQLGHLVIVEGSDVRDDRGGGATGGDDVGRACHDHLMSMLELYDGGSDVRCAPDLVTFSTVLNVLGRGGREDGRDCDHGDGGEDYDADEGRAREILDIMLYLSGVDDGGGGMDGLGGGRGERDGDDRGTVAGIAPRPDFEFDVRPRNRHFNVVLALMAKRRRVDGATLERARWYVDVMELLRREEEEEEKDGIAGGRSRRRLPRSHGDDGIALEDGGSTYFENPPVDHRGGDPATSLYDDGGTDSSLGDEWLSTSPPPLYGSMRSAPDIFTYNTLLNIAARSGRPEEAEGILKGMIKNSTDGTSAGVRPDRISFNTVRPPSLVLSFVPRLASKMSPPIIFSVMQSSRNWAIAVIIVLTISVCHPFETQVLSAWSKAKSHTGRLKTEQILDEMHKMAKDGDTDVRPDRVSVHILNIL